MTWQELSEPSREKWAELRGQRKLKLYADEDMEADAVAALRRHGVNIRSAQELGVTGKPDEFHAARALQLKRVLLTKNAKHFLDDRKIPLQKTYGVIAIACDVANEAEYTRVLGTILYLFVE